MTHLRHARHEWQRTNRRPVTAQLVQGQPISKPRAHMRRRDSIPNYISDISRHGVKRARVEIRFVSKSKNRAPRADTRAKNSNAFVAFRFQPLNCRTRSEERRV